MKWSGCLSAIILLAGCGRTAAGVADAGPDDAREHVAGRCSVIDRLLGRCGTDGGDGDRAPVAASNPPDAALDPAAPLCAPAGVTTLAADGEGVDFGEGTAVGDGAIVGLTTRGEHAGVAAVARLAPHAEPRLVSLGDVSGDDPPPKAFARGAEAFAAAYLVESTDGGSRAASRAHGARRLSILRVTDAPEVLVTIPQAGDESPAFDVVVHDAGALVVWDEDAPPDVGRPSPRAGLEPVPPRGVIRAALLAPDLRSVVQVATVSPDIADAERPRVAKRDGGYWVAWVTRRPEPAADAAPGLEGPAEDRAFAWVELLALDDHGRPSGAVRRLSPGTGHVAGYAITGSGARLDAAIVLDDEGGDGASGQLLHVVVVGDEAPRTELRRMNEVGRGTTPWIAWTPGAPGLLAHVDEADRTRLTLLDVRGDGAPVDSLESALDGARPSVALAPSGGSRVVLAVSPGRGAASWLRCATTPVAAHEPASSPLADAASSSAP